MGLRPRLQHSHQRAEELPFWLHRYNWHRPHGGINGNTPISRLGLEREQPVEAPHLVGPMDRFETSRSRAAADWVRAEDCGQATVFAAGGFGVRTPRDGSNDVRSCHVELGLRDPDRHDRAVRDGTDLGALQLAAWTNWAAGGSTRAVAIAGGERRAATHAACPEGCSSARTCRLSPKRRRWRRKVHATSYSSWHFRSSRGRIAAGCGPSDNPGSRQSSAHCGSSGGARALPRHHPRRSRWPIR